jgi:hypothetical protein
MMQLATTTTDYSPPTDTQTVLDNEIKFAF